MASENLYICLYFFLLILLGTILLWLPPAWNGDQALPLEDALFTAASAACVTGLITVDTALYSRFGQLVIMLLIQLGGLGIISFTTLFLVIPANKLSLKGSKIIREYYLDSVEFKATQILRQIILITLIIETAGTILLYKAFAGESCGQPLFYALFHSISAFCNAGFSLFSDNLAGYTTNTVVNLTIMGLIITGGLGFVVIRDFFQRLSGHKKRFTIHTKIVILMTCLLIPAGAGLLYLIESPSLFKGYSTAQQWLISFFHAVTPRTAGFNTVNPAQMHLTSRLLLMLLMFCGGAPGSTAGGIKVTTLFLILLCILGRPGQKTGLDVFQRKIPPATLMKALLFLIRCFALLACGIILLLAAEYLASPDHNVAAFAIIFECFSAFGTVGLSMGITAQLSLAGKLIIICTMLAGKVGMIILAMNVFTGKTKKDITYPKEEVLIG